MNAATASVAPANLISTTLPASLTVPASATASGSGFPYGRAPGSSSNAAEKPLPFGSFSFGFGIATPYPSLYFKNITSSAGSSDLKLVSSDNFTFPVHKTYLSTASVVLRDMLDMSGGSAVEKAEVQMSEDAQTLDMLLPFCYPGPPSYLVECTQKKLMDWVKAADKLGITRAVEAFGNALCRKNWLCESGLELYTLACQIEHQTLRHYAKAAAAASPSLLSQARTHINAMGATNYADLLETAEKNKNILMPADVHRHYQISVLGITIPDTERLTSRQFFTDLSADNQRSAVSGNTII